MNPRDEKILLTMKKSRKKEYEDLVPPQVIQKAFPWLDPYAILADLHQLAEDGYLFAVLEPINRLGSWYILTQQGERECERILFENAERKRNRMTNIWASIIGAVLGAIAMYFFKI